MSRCDGILEFFLINSVQMISLVRVQEAVSSNSRVYKGKQRNKLNWKVRPFFGTNQFANAAAVLMLTYDDNQKAKKAHCRLAFSAPWIIERLPVFLLSMSAQPQWFFLSLLVGLHGSLGWQHRYYSTKCGHWRKDVLEGHAPFFLINFFCERCSHD